MSFGRKTSPLVLGKFLAKSFDSFSMKRDSTKFKLCIFVMLKNVDIKFEESGANS